MLVNLTPSAGLGLLHEITHWSVGGSLQLSFRKGDLHLWILPDATDTNVGDMSGSAIASAIAN